MIERIELILEPMLTSEKTYQLKITVSTDGKKSTFTQLAGFDDFKSRLEIFMDMATRQMKLALEENP